MTLEEESGDILEPEDFEWGGDGSDLDKPVRAHVLAALVPTDKPYDPPLDELLSIGDARVSDRKRAQVVALGLAQEHVPELIRMARDRVLNTSMSDSDEVWGPIHALTALEQLDVGEHVADLIPLFDVESDWFGEGLPEVLKNAGAAALEPLRAYIQDQTRWIYGRAYAISTFSKLVELHPELRDRVVHILTDSLARPKENAPYLNADLISELADLDAVEALPVIRRAFEQDRVDETVMGGWGEVLSELGQAVDPTDPLVRRSEKRWATRQAQFRASVSGAPFAPATDLASAKQRRSEAKKKQKNKRKQSAASRQANKKKRK